MMKWVFSGLILFAIVTGAMTGRMDQVSSAAISECAKAITLTLTLAGSMAMWSGIMKVAKESELTKVIAKILSPITCFLFKGLDKTSYAMQLITMNITANLLGLGNAATPLGIAAITELEKESPKELKGVATNHMITLVVLNTASITLIPTTVAVLRLKYGSESPLDILPCVLIASVISLFVGLFMAMVLNKIFPAKKQKD